MKERDRELPQAADAVPGMRTLVLDTLTPAIDALVSALEELRAQAPDKAKHPALLGAVTFAAGIVSVASLAALAIAIGTPASHEWWVKVAVFAAVATVPHWFVGWFARMAVALGKDLRKGDHVIGFENPGAFLGIFERTLFLAALVAGFEEFIAAWFVLKGIAGYRIEGPHTKARRTFQLFLLNNAVSLAGVALGWLAWKLLA